MADDEKKIEETDAVEAPAEDAAVAEPEAETPDAAVAEPEAETPEPASENQVPEPDVAEPEPDAAEPEAAPEAPAPAAKTKSLKHVPRSLRRTRTKPTREKPATRKAITRTEKPESEPGRRQERRGVVVSDKGDKTIVVKVDVIKSHPKYKKVVRRSVRFHAHDEANTAGVGDTVRIVETRPLSKQKRWRLAEIVEKAR
jgi:small subunit ribosomal protein S17